MTATFADTSYYLAHASPQDQHHAAAIAWGGQLRGRFVTTEFVLVELGNSLTRGGDRSLFLTMTGLIRSDRKTIVVPLSSKLLQKSVTLFAKRPDKEWSLTDCTSFIVMRERKLSKALTADQHFVQAGYRALLLERP